MQLEVDEVHLWLASLNLNSTALLRRWKSLDRDERDRAARFRFSNDHRDFIAARGILRDILARYLRQPPAQLRLSRGAFGKPALRADSERVQLEFNLSHSRGLALYAVTRTGELGVDLEQVQPSVLHDMIPERFFSRHEALALRALPLELQSRSFFLAWTRKEALGKARGDGLLSMLGRSSDLPSPTGDVTRAKSDLQSWAILSLVPAPGYVAALAVNGGDMVLRFWQWNDILLRALSGLGRSNLLLSATESNGDEPRMEVPQDAQPSPK